MPLRKSTGLVATMTRTVPVGPITRSPSTPVSPPIRSRPWRRSPIRTLTPPISSSIAARGADLLPSPSRHRSQLHHCRDEARPRVFVRLAPLARFASPTEQLLWCQPMAARNHRHRRSRLQRLRNDPRLVVHRPTTPAAGAGDHLDAPDLALRLKRRFKSRHKPIPILTPGSAPSHLVPTIKRRPQNTAYAVS